MKAQIVFRLSTILLSTMSLANPIRLLKSETAPESVVNVTLEAHATANSLAITNPDTCIPDCEPCGHDESCCSKKCSPSWIGYVCCGTDQDFIPGPADIVGGSIKKDDSIVFVPRAAPAPNPTLVSSAVPVVTRGKESEVGADADADAGVQDGTTESLAEAEAGDVPGTPDGWSPVNAVDTNGEACVPCHGYCDRGQDCCSKMCFSTLFEGNMCGC